MVLGLGTAISASVVVAGDSYSPDTTRHTPSRALTPDQLRSLRSRIPGLRQLSDDELLNALGHMSDSYVYLSRETLRGDIGVLALGHGYGEIGDPQFTRALEDVARSKPTAAVFGMSVAESEHVQKAVMRLEAAGCEWVIVLPLEIGEPSDLTRQWRYVFGVEQQAAYLDVRRVALSAKVRFAPTPTASPVIASILSDNLRRVSRHPSSEVALLLAHGPMDADENRMTIALLETHARTIRADLGLSRVWAATLQDDAEPEIRAANVQRIRHALFEANAQGKRALVAPVLMTGRGLISKKITRDLESLNFELADFGIAEHPLFQEWLANTVAAEASATTVRDER